MKPKFTTGPWKYYQSGDGRIHGEHGKRMVADLCIYGNRPRDLEEDTANAHLISAAPDMYKALEDCLENDSGELSLQTVHDIMKVLRKARGE